MANTIDQAFIRQYESEVSLQFQRGVKLLGTVRTKNGVRGESLTFQKLGKGAAQQKARHGLVPVLNPVHTDHTATLTDWYAGDWVDQLDELKINIDERGSLTETHGYALGRRTDQIIIDALDTTTNTNAWALTSEHVIRNEFLETYEVLADNDAADDGMVYAVVSPRVWSHLLTIEEFANGDYMGDDLPYAAKGGMSARYWLGVKFMKLTDLPISSTTRTCYMWNRKAVGLGIQKMPSTDIQWHNDRAAHFINSCMAMGSTLIDETGAVKFTVDESSGLVTS